MERQAPVGQVVRALPGTKENLRWLVRYKYTEWTSGSTKESLSESKLVGRISEFDFCRDMFALLTDAFGLRNLDLQSSRQNGGKTHDYTGTV
ncbi:hypothetical protein H8E77_12065 [bacterium]|nr:hypothetical protein [bacterium]